MSANSDEMTARKPASSSAHTACSRELPQPKFLRATRIDAPWKRDLFSAKSLFSVPSGFSFQSTNSPLPIPARTTALRNCLGMIWSVSTLARSSGATIPVKFLNFCIAISLTPLAHVDKMSRYRRRRRHRRTHQMCAAALALTAFEIAIRRARASLARRQYVGIHREAHAASRLAPLEARFGENSVEAETLRLSLHVLRPRHHHRMNSRCNFVALDDTRR